MNLNFENRFSLPARFSKAATASCTTALSGNRIVRARRALSLILSFAITLSSCAPRSALPAPTSIPPQPTDTEPAATSTQPVTASTEPTATGNEVSLFKAGQNYSDTSGDMEISFLDVVGFRATVNEESETLEVVLHMRDIPPTATLEQSTKFIQYSWVVFVYLDAAKGNPTDIPGDYYFAVNTSIYDPSELATPGVPTPTPSGPVIVPINQLLENKGVLDSEGMPKSSLDAVADPELDLLTLTGRVPGITSRAVFGVSTYYFDSAIDRPDNYLESANRPEATQTPTVLAPQVSDATRLIPAREVRAYPGPVHYAGDVLSFEIQTDGSFDESVAVKLTLDNQDTKEIIGQGLFDRIVLPLALDTTNLTGKHTLRFATADGDLKQTYSFEVLPRNQRPENEENASWLVNEIDCCRLHYISNTAAARDIKFISEQFQQASQEVASITGGSMDTNLNVYLIDRIWGNGGFAREVGLVISYTDRYYGPTIGEKGLATLARHELSHVTHLPGQVGDGIAFNYEGLAVYVAGGHYKPEPLAERGAALYDLGYYVPVDESIKQHELSYLYSATVLTYIAETYGSEKVWDFVTADVDPKDGQSTPLETAVQATLGIPLKQFDQNFKAWLESKDPGQQLDDLRLTIELQDLRRQYQETYTPPPDSIAWSTADTLTRPEYLPVLIREADAPANAATELIIADAQQAIVEGDYSTAERLIKILGKVITTGNFEDALAKDYLDTVLVLVEAGYDVLSLNIQGDQAMAQVTQESPVITSLELQKRNGIWQVKR